MPEAIDVGAAYMAIANLIGTYTFRIDAGDFDALADLFADAVITSEGSDVAMTGRDEVLAGYSTHSRRYDDNGTPHTRHVTTNLVVDIDAEGGAATAQSYWTVLQQVDDLPLQPILCGEYRDTFRLADGIWGFSHRHIVRRLMGDTSHHIITT